MPRFVDPGKVMAKLGQTPPQHIRDLRAKIDLRTLELEVKLRQQDLAASRSDASCGSRPAGRPLHLQAEPGVSCGKMSEGVTLDDIQEVVRWKLELDGLYADWIKS